MTNAPKPSAHLTKTLFSGGNFALEPAGPFKLAFWYNLLRYRPFWLLGGLWVCCVLIVLVALGGLMDPGVEAEKTPPATQVPTSVDINDPGDSDSFITTDVPPSEIDEVFETPLGTEIEPAPEVGFNLGILVAFIGICTSGCWGLARYLQAPRALPKAQRRQRKSRPAQPKPKPMAPVPAISQPPVKRLKPFSAAQIKSLYVGGNIAWNTNSQDDTASPELVNAAQGQASAAVPQPIQTSADASTLAAKEAPVAQPEDRETAAAATNTRLVPESMTHQLDWPEGSIAHQMDLRQRRSLSSLL